jgi:cytoplasmic iron level regulating protein YaaA (DUF328/UPF0246 family)
MRPPTSGSVNLPRPVLLDQAKLLDTHLKTLSINEIMVAMKVSLSLAKTTSALIADWTESGSSQRAAIDSFLGDIYSGLQVPDWTTEDRDYANQCLRILSGLYGVLRPLDGIHPYRLEMGYRLAPAGFSNLYTYWGDSVARTLPQDSIIINLAALEYSKLVSPYIDKLRIISPMFLTISIKTGLPTFVVVHAKIARGAFAGWLVKNRIDDVSLLRSYRELGYNYSPELSTETVPVFICQKFLGLGLSVRLS